MGHRGFKSPPLRHPLDRERSTRARAPALFVVHRTHARSHGGAVAIASEPEHNPERCLSGRRYALGKRVCRKRHRGFESPPLRHHADNTTIAPPPCGPGPMRWDEFEPGQAGNGAALRTTPQARGARAQPGVGIFDAVRAALDRSRATVRDAAQDAHHAIGSRVMHARARAGLGSRAMHATCERTRARPFVVGAGRADET